MNAFFDFASKQPLLIGVIAITLIAAMVFLISKFKVTFKGFVPSFTSRIKTKTQTELEEKIAFLEEKLKFSHTADYFTKTDNGEYVGFFVARKPYIEVWCDGNWNAADHHDIFDRLRRLWDDEQEIIFYGKDPNIPMDIYRIIEEKAKELPSITIYCDSSSADFFTKYFQVYSNVKIIQR